MIFHEIYGTYYSIISEIITMASEKGPTEKEILELVKRKGFSETVVVIPDALKSGRWPFLNGRFESPDIPLTTTEKMWLKAILSDPRIRLFVEKPHEIMDMLEEVEPLYEQGFFVYFDRYADGDNYEDPEYIRNFRRILSAMQDRKKVRIVYEGRRGLKKHTLSPLKIEYSAKDDKFRILGRGEKKNLTFNMANIRSVVRMEDQRIETNVYSGHLDSVTFLLKDQRNALERAMISFSDLQKKTEKISDDQYQITLYYYREDETEILIRLLTFGPLLEVTGPKAFRDKLAQRVMKQKL